MTAVVSGRKCCPMLMLVRLLMQITLSTATSLGRTAIVTYDPPALHELTEGQNATVVVTLRVPEDKFEKIEGRNTTWDFSLRSYHPEIADASSDSTSSMLITKNDFELDSNKYYTKNATFTVNGYFLGKTALRVRLVSAEQWDDDDDWTKNERYLLPKAAEEEISTLDVWVRRSDESMRLTFVFVVSVVILVTIGNVMMGCELDLDLVWKTLKRPVAPGIGFCTQFIVMPILAYIIAQLLFVPKGLYSMALGLFITGCSPGGGASNFWTLLLDGNVSLSVTMTFISTLASLVMLPLWLSLLGGEFIQGFSSSQKVIVPYGKLTRSLLAMVIPLLIGVAIQKYKPEWAKSVKKVLRPFLVFVLIFLIVFGVLTNMYMLKQITIPGVLGGLLLPWCGFMFGCFSAILCRRPPGDVTAIAIETGIQNTGIAILMLKASFSQPDADISSVMPVIVASFTPGPLLLGAAIHLTLKALKKKRQTSADLLVKGNQSVLIENGVDAGTVDEKGRLPLSLELQVATDSSSNESVAEDADDRVPISPRHCHKPLTML